MREDFIQNLDRVFDLTLYSIKKFSSNRSVYEAYLFEIHKFKEQNTFSLSPAIITAVSIIKSILSSFAAYVDLMTHTYKAEERVGTIQNLVQLLTDLKLYDQSIESNNPMELLNPVNPETNLPAFVDSDIPSDPLEISVLHAINNSNRLNQNNLHFRKGIGSLIYISRAYQEIENCYDSL